MSATSANAKDLPQVQYFLDKLNTTRGDVEQRIAVAELEKKAAAASAGGGVAAASPRRPATAVKALPDVARIT